MEHKQMEIVRATAGSQSQSQPASNQAIREHPREVGIGTLDKTTACIYIRVRVNAPMGS